MDVFFQLTLNSIVAGSLYVLVALGFTLMYRVTRFFNFAHGAVAAVGGYVVFFLISLIGLNVWFAGFIGVFFAGCLGFGLYRLVYLPLLAKRASNMVLLIASLGVFTVLQATLAILFTSQFHTLSSGSQRTFTIFGGVITQVQVIAIVLMIAVAVGMVLLLRYTLFGKAVRAVGDAEEVSKIVGINTVTITSFVFFLGSAVAGLAGILVGFDVGIEPTMGFELLLKGVIASIVGGVGSLTGAVLGGFLLGFVENFGIWKISGEWKDAIAFGLLILFLLFRPRGIMNT